MQLSVYNQKGSKMNTLEVSDGIFGVRINPSILHQAAMAQSANARLARANTKERGEVSGGGKKPWKQKGTGRARQGSIRSPQWRGGGVVFGPRSERNFSKKINKRTRRSAIQMVLSDRAASGEIFVLDSFAMTDKKTKSVVTLMKALPLKRGKTMVALPSSEKDAGRLAANINRVTSMWVGSLNVVDLLNHINLVTTVEGIKEIEKIYRSKSSKSSKSRA
ncbi:MAG: 50S ribosomal protein L4 [bacterium]|nr:50S ribosomal protein L4 [bacterium]